MLDERGRSGHSASIGNKMSLRCARSHKRMLPLMLLLLLHCCDSFVVSDVRFACALSPHFGWVRFFDSFRCAAFVRGAHSILFSSCATQRIPLFMFSRAQKIRLMRHQQSSSLRCDYAFECSLIQNRIHCFRRMSRMEQNQRNQRIAHYPYDFANQLIGQIIYSRFSMIFLIPFWF